VSVSRFLRAFADAFMRNETLDVAAQVAYFSVLAIFPFAMFVLTLMGFLPLGGLEQQLTSALEHVVPPEVARMIDDVLKEIVGKQRGWLLVATLAFALWSASGGISGLTTALNRAYGVTETRHILRVRARAIVVTLIGVVAAVVTATAMLLGPELASRAWRFFGLGGAVDRVWAALRYPLGVVAMISMVAFMYVFLPNVERRRRRHILPGSIVAVLGWIAASLGFRLYVAHFGAYAKSYGALATVVLLLLWLYLWGVMVIVGGEVNAICDRLRHRHPRGRHVFSWTPLRRRSQTPSSSP
jgi:membrane protein